MALEDFVAFVVTGFEDPFYDKYRYSKIAKSAGLEHPMTLDSSSDGLGRATLVANHVKGKNAVVISKYHSDIALCHNDKDTALVVFDRKINYDPESRSYFDNFLGERKGPVYVVGTNEPIKEADSLTAKRPRIKTYSPQEAKKFLDDINADSPNNVLLSLDVSVFGPDVTRAHYGRAPRLTEHLAARARKLRIGWKTHLTPKEVTGLSLDAIAGRRFVGVNIAGYNHHLDKDNHPTADLLAAYLHNVLTYRLPVQH